MARARKKCPKRGYKNVFKAIRHNSPFKIPIQAASPYGKAYLKRNVFAGFWKDCKDGGNLPVGGGSKGWESL